MRSLSWKLAGTLLLVVLISVALMAVLTNFNTSNEFQQYINQGNMLYAQNIATSLGSYYEQNNSWADIETVLNGLKRTNSDRLIVANISGVIVGDTGQDLLGISAQSAGLSEGISIISGSNNYGSLYVINTSSGMGSGQGRGFMGGNGGAKQSSSPASIPAEQNFLDQVNRSLMITGLISILAALLLGLILTRQITRPVRALIKGVHHLGMGHLDYRVAVKSRDELGELAATFNNMADGLDRAEQERRRIIADVAHELRTPLTVIEGTVRAIEDGIFSPDKEHLDVIKGQTDLLVHLTSDLRVLSQAESGQMKLELKYVDVADLVQKTLAQLNLKAAEKNVVLLSDVSPGIPKIMIDPMRIEQSLSNLLTNALRYTPSGGSITVKVRDMKDDPVHGLDKSHIQIAVIDTGEGIAPEHLPHMFERFYRIDPSRSRNEGGAGLGLAIVRQMVMAHGGRVWVESEKGKGSRFVMALPLDNHSV